MFLYYVVLLFRVSKLYDEIEKIIGDGINKPKAIQRELKKRGLGDVNYHTINAYKTKYLKSSKNAQNQGQTLNNTVNNQPSTSSISNNGFSDNKSQQTGQEVETQTQEESTPQETPQETSQETQQFPSKEENYQQPYTKEVYQQSTTLNKSPTGGIIRGQSFNLRGSEQAKQPEGDLMTSAYTQESEKSEDSENQIPIKVERVSQFTPYISEALFRTPQMKNLTHGYEVSEIDKSMLQEDTETIIKNRLPNGVSSEYGDFINMGLTFGLIFGKSLWHRITNPELKAELEQATEQVEQGFKQAYEEKQKQAQETQKLIEESQAQSEDLGDPDNINENNNYCQESECDKDRFRNGLCRTHFWKSQLKNESE